MAASRFAIEAQVRPTAVRRILHGLFDEVADERGETTRSSVNETGSSVAKPKAISRAENSPEVTRLLP
jgi:hypothetical protein